MKHRELAAMSLLGFAGVLFLAGTLSVAQSAQGVETANAKSLGLVGKPAPEFHLQDIHHGNFDLTEARGKVVVLAFWATWCPPCRTEMSGLAKLQRELAPHGVEVIPVAFDNPGKAQDFLTKKSIDLWSLTDEDGQVASLYGAHALPKTFVLGRDGTVVKVLIGKVSEEELRQVVDVVRR